MSWHSQPRERKKGKVGRKPGKKRKGVKDRDLAIAGSSVATKERKAAQAAGRTDQPTV